MRAFAFIAVLPGLALLQPALPAQEGQAPVQVYDTKADARADIAAALAKAGEENQRVLIQWGGNWCGWCVKLNDILTKDQDLGHELLYEYQVVHVDVGQFDKNLDLAAQYGARIQDGVPFLTVLGADGKVLANQETGGFEVDGRHDPKKLLEFLKGYRAAPWKAEELLQNALARAAKEEKQVLLMFGAPW
ncbi:MAG: thioredoxin family protein [Planctomycetota bacterium]|nr:MAG: thioredoxin family protein [Planctomycetota bacterium]